MHCFSSSKAIAGRVDGKAQRRENAQPSEMLSPNAGVWGGVARDEAAVLVGAAVLDCLVHVRGLEFCPQVIGTPTGLK